MRRIVQNIFTLILGIIGVIGGGVWAYKTQWNDMEPLIVMAISFIEVLSYFVLKLFPDNFQQENSSLRESQQLPSHHTANRNSIDSHQQQVNNNDLINKQINIQKNEGEINM